MPRTAINPSLVQRIGTKVTFVPFDSIGGMALANKGTITIAINNPTANSQIFRFKVPRLVDGDLSVGDRVATIPAGEVWAIGHFPPETYSQSDGTVHIDHSFVLVDMTDEATVQVSGKTYQITDQTKRVLDPGPAPTVKDAGLVVAAGNIESVDRQLGKVTFVPGYVVLGAVTVSGRYIPVVLISAFDLR